MKKIIISVMLSLLMVLSSIPIKAEASSKEVTEEMVFSKFYNDLLNNDFYSNLYRKWHEDCTSALDTVSEGEEIAAIAMDVFCKGSDYIATEIGAIFGISNDNIEKNNKEVAYDVLKEYMVKYFTGSKTFKEIHKQWKEAVEVLGIYDKALDFSKQVDKDLAKTAIGNYVDYFSDEELNELFKDDGAIKQLSEFIDGVNEIEKFNKVFFVSLELMQMDVAAIDDLLDTLDWTSDLHKALREIRNDIDKDTIQFLMDNYFSNRAISALSKSISKYALRAIFSDTGAIFFNVIKEVSYLFYKKTNITVSDIHHAIMLGAYVTETERTLERIIMKFNNGEGTNDDIQRYKSVYNFYLACFGKYLEKCKTLVHKHWLIDQRSVNEKRLDNRLGMYLDTIKSLSYDNYIRYVISVVQKKVDSNEYTINEYDTVEVRDKNGNLIDENYDSTESIRNKLEVIQSMYKPNIGQTWTASYKGSIQCNGFARMVFNLLYGYNISGYIGSDRSVLQNETNVVKVGQLKGENVTKNNLISVFSNAKIGDYLQVCGNMYGQHSAIITSVDDVGVTVYDCNWSNIYCEIKTHKFTWDNLVNWYKEPYVENNKTIPNGISIYRANNYASIYGDGDDLFYDDSANFVINDGVLIKYNGWQSYVVIPNDVSEIAESAFAYNKNIEYVEIPNTVVKVGSSAFKRCTSLVRVYLPDSIESIGSEAFEGCTRLEGAHLPQNEKYKKIEWGLFRNCNTLADVDIPGSITDIGSGAFEDCYKLNKVDLPNGLKTLEGAAFKGCTMIEEISIPKSLTSTYGYSSSSSHGPFSNCDNLKEVSFEEGITVIQNDLFENCTGIEEIVIPDTVTKIRFGAFCNCRNLKKVVLSKNLEEIDHHAFNGCTNLNKVDLPDGLKALEGAAFEGCTMLEEINIPKSLTNTYGYSSSSSHGPFSNCDNLKEVSFEEGITVIQNDLFENCTGLEEIVIPETVTNIMFGAFSNCSGLKSITLFWNVNTIASSAFANDSNIIIHGIKGSYVETYADENNIGFDAISFEHDHVWSVLVVSEDPTCAHKGKKILACVKCGETKTEDIPALGHDCYLSTWTWTGTSKAVATFTCSNGCGHTETVEAKITNKVTTPATCETKGVRTYTATVCFNDKEYKTTKKASIAVKGHSYGAPTWTWTGTTKAVATFTCSNGCGHTEAVEATITNKVTTPATCETKGVRTYTATVCFNDKEYKTTKKASIAVKGHSYGAPTWTWTGTSKAVVTFTCKNGCGHTETADAKITNKVTKAATCTTSGTRTYTAKVSFNGKNYNATKTKSIAAMGHSYGAPTWTWTGTTKAVATFTCANDDSHVKKVTATITSKVTQKATITTAGTKTFTATVTFNGGTYKKSKTAKYYLFDKSKTGLQKYNDKLYYTKNGVLYASFTGFAKYGSNWYYVSKGKVSTTKTAIIKGKVNGTTASWYVKNGKVMLTYSGTVKIGTKSYKIKKGKAVG